MSPNDTTPKQPSDHHKLPPSPSYRHHYNHHNPFRFSKLALPLSLLLSTSLFFIALLIHHHPSPSILFSHHPSTTTPTTTSICHPNLSDSSPTNLSHIVFALSGSANTWSDRRRYPLLWWHPNTTRGSVWIDRNPGPNFTRPGSYPPLRISPPLITDKRASDRLARLVKESFGLGLNGVRWFVMGDDDTLFFKENLVRVLSKYDHNGMYYIGGDSESVEQNTMHGYDTAFGGGGFAVSYPLACEMVRILDDCILRYHTYYGSDEKVAACVAELGVPLTREPGFHQLDIRGNPYGFLAAHPVAPLVSLHHLDHVDPLFPGETQLNSVKKLMNAYNVDPGHILQQSFCYDHRRKWSVSISWGYTAQVYPYMVSSRVLSIPLQTFHTWRSRQQGPFVFNARPLSGDPCEQPIIYFLDHVEEVGENQTITTYQRSAAAEAGQQCNKTAYKYALSISKITVFAAKTAPDKWLKAPRRDCCEIADSWSLKTNMQVKLRTCKAGETITM